MCDQLFCDTAHHAVFSDEEGKRSCCVVYDVVSTRLFAKLLALYTASAHIHTFTLKLMSSKSV